MGPHAASRTTSPPSAPARVCVCMNHPHKCLGPCLPLVQVLLKCRRRGRDGPPAFHDPRQEEALPCCDYLTRSLLSPLSHKLFVPLSTGRSLIIFVM